MRLLVLVYPLTQYGGAFFHFMVLNLFFLFFLGVENPNLITFRTQETILDRCPPNDGGGPASG